LLLLKSRRKGFLCWLLFLNPAAAGPRQHHQFILVRDSAPELPAVDLVFLVSLPVGLVFAADFFGPRFDSRRFSFSA
jgi:hypothetical protein